MSSSWIVIAEDSPLQAAMLRRLLTENGFRVTVGRDGQQAWEELQAAPDPPALIISDVDMPEVDGYELCRRVKADPRLNSVPFVLLTNLSDPHNVIWGLQAGADNYLTKPIEAGLLLERIQALLDSPALYTEGAAGAPLSFSLGGQRFAITSSRGQILNLLLSTFEGAVWQNRQLRRSNEELSLAQRETAEKNEQLKDLMEQQNRFLGMVTHDMRNPLGVIMGYSRILAEGVGGELPPKQAKFARAIHQSTQSLLTLVNDLLEMSEIESGKLRLEKTETDLTALLAQAVELNGFLAESKNIRIGSRLAALPLQEVDARKIEQVINNLLTNAVKFSHAGTEVFVELREDGDQVCFAVVDQGQGIPPEEQKSLFQPYQKTSVRSTAGESSTGLGLAIVKRIVEGHGGAIEVESQPGRGSTFRVRLPNTARGASV